MKCIAHNTHRTGDLQVKCACELKKNRGKYYIACLILMVRATNELEKQKSNEIDFAGLSADVKSHSLATMNDHDDFLNKKIFLRVRV